MAEKLINPTEQAGRNFRIDVDEAAKRDFPGLRGVQVQLTDAGTKKYDVYRKDIPAFLKGKKFNGKEINWLNNFGLKVKNAARYEASVDSYTVILDKISEAKEYVYYDGPTDVFDEKYLHHLDVDDLQGDSSKLQAVLTRGDPATGWIN